MTTEILNLIIAATLAGLLVGSSIFFAVNESGYRRAARRARQEGHVSIGYTGSRSWKADSSRAAE